MAQPLHIGWRRRPTEISALSVGRAIACVGALKLGDGSRTDRFAGKDRLFLSFIDDLMRRDSALVLFGDLIDLEQAWTVERVFRAHHELFDGLRALCRQRRITYLMGPGDPSPTWLTHVLGLQTCDELRIGTSTAAVHGWQFDPKESHGEARRNSWWRWAVRASERLAIGRVAARGTRLHGPAIHNAAKRAMHRAGLTTLITAHGQPLSRTEDGPATNLQTGTWTEGHTDLLRFDAGMWSTESWAATR